MDDLKMGARNNGYDKERIKEIRSSAKRIHELTNEMEPDEDDKTTKSTMTMSLTEYKITASTVIKALADMELDVLLVPFGGPDNGKDTDGQYFDAKTVTQHEIYKTIPAYYYHGFTPEGKPQGDPEPIGMMTYDHTDEKGHWYRAILDKTSELAKRIWDAAKRGLARASSGSIPHIIRDQPGGHIDKWPVVEGSLIDEGDKRHPANAYAVALPVMKAHYEKLGLEIPDVDKLPEANEAADNLTIQTRSNKMENEEVQKMIDAALAAKEADTQAKAAKAAEIQAEVDKAVKAKEEELTKQFAAEKRLPGGVYVKKFSDTDRYDNLDAADTAVLIGVLKSAKKDVSEGALKALSLKLEEDQSSVGAEGRKAMKAAGIKAGEIDYSTSSGYGDEWVGAAYSTSLWESIRIQANVMSKIPSVEVPQGYESITLPLESTDPIWYNISENTTNGSTVGAPAPTITSSRVATGNASLTLAKMGARVVWTGEMEESSLIPFANQVRQQLATSGAEYLDSAIIDGDTETTDSTNINNIGGAEVTGGHYLAFNGFRKSCLVTTTANSRAGGALTVEDFLETMKLMGSAGINGLDTSKCAFIVDPNTYYKALALPEVLTRDVFASPTLEGGKLTGLWGYPLMVSGSMHFMSSARKANSAGKVNTTDTTANLYGAILAVRWDQWKLGWRRRITMETTRFANSDSNEIVAMLRVGLKQRDTEASAITYGVTV